MKILISLFLWIIGLIHFLIIAIIIWILFLISSPIKIHPVIRLLFNFQLKIMGVDYTITGLDNFDHKSSFIIMGNHESLFDIFAVPAAIPMYFVAVEADYHFSMPIWGKLTKKWGNIPINRNNINEAKKSLIMARNVIKEGTSILIMPEGGRTITGELKEFKKGPFHLALESKADILPFAIIGLFEYNNKNSWNLNPKKVTCTFGKPILYNSIKDYSVEELQIKLFKTISQLKNSKC